MQHNPGKLPFAWYFKIDTGLFDFATAACEIALLAADIVWLLIFFVAASADTCLSWMISYTQHVEIYLATVSQMTCQQGIFFLVSLMLI